MNWKATIILLIIMVVYVTVGGVIFHIMEGSNETTTRANISSQFVNFLQRYPCVNSDDLADLLTSLQVAFKAGVVEIGNYSSSHTNWDMYNSIFFSATVVTTIGYGNVSPSTEKGRSFCVFFAIIGIPLMLIVLAGIGEQQNRLFNYVRKIILRKLDRNFTEKTESIIGSLFTAVIGLALFFFIPAIVFSTMEGWTYNESVYYTFVTLFTVGFGDYVAGESNYRYQYIGVYRLVIACWIVVGLAYCAGLITECQETYSEIFWKTQSAVKTAAAGARLKMSREHSESQTDITLEDVNQNNYNANDQERQADNSCSYDCADSPGYNNCPESPTPERAKRRESREY